ncbi:hydantoinase/oxoprolinase family protein [Herbiconiux sp. KACC 21604]|uniref:hydantoinase/oxoprolinase family protein n=1 Tax=unclassified Herbiconiux TaxID=2618217 RepID=UPI00149128A2|nr:hydantoinase/oxoprolinase family protein [Herbiconiux sp. SALV-R1]QJU54131.1 hydantoinase/oxoprolinase family protein [Herbiconiux sp. SALV-R1]WPO85183.1 hydantoinase/oxoprolinase family protein [Herbiconiux sp. KACC 21604]
MIGVDVGGTFTDVVSITDGKVAVTKVPSSRTDPAGSVVEGARRLGVDESAVFNHASTMGLNAVLERRLPKVGLLTTEGFRDVLDRGSVHRPLSAQTDPSWRRSFGDAARPLVPRYLRRGVVERKTADGATLIELDEAQAREQIELLGRCGVEGVAICLINAYVDDSHEQRLRELVREILGDGVEVSLSAATSPLAKEYERASTTVIDVVMKLLFSDYAGQLHSELGGLGFTGQLNFADCAANLLPWQEALERPFRILFAGPAAGTVSSGHLGQAIGRRDILCADVGGTSTDVSIIVDGAPFVQNTFEIEHDLIINALSTEVSSVGAGGGSLVTVSSSGGILVGPGSAGAEPGPACYGRGGTEPTVTDAALLIGILDPAGFAGGEFELDAEASRRAFESLDTPVPFEERVRTAYRLAVAHMAEEILNVAVRHGVDIRDFSLMAYGAAGGMLLPAALDLLPLKEVVIPPHPGLFSAIGLLSADQVYYEAESAYVVFGPDTAAGIDEVYTRMEERLRARLGAAAEGLPVRRSFDGRLVGQSWETPFVQIPAGAITAESIAEVVAGFHDSYELRNGNRFDAFPVEGVTYRVELVVPSEKVSYEPAPEVEPFPAVPEGTTTLRHLSAEPIEAEWFSRAALEVGATVTGPAVIREELSTTFVAAGQTATAGRCGELIITSRSDA